MTDRKPPQGPPPLPPQESYRPATPARPVTERQGRPPQPHEQDPYATRLRPPADDPRLNDPRQSSYAQSAFDPPQRPGYPPQHAGPQHGHPQHMPPQMRQQRPRGTPPPYRDGAPERERGGFGLVKGLLVGLAALIVIAGTGFAYLVYALPPETVRDQIAAAVKAKTGRDLTISGDTSFTLYPSLGITMRDVALSPPPGMKGKPLVTMAGLDASVQVLPLLKREVVIERLVLRKPVFELYSDAGGRKSWEFAEAPRPVRLAQATTTDAPATLPIATGSSSASAGLEQLKFGDVRVEDGTLRYTDAKTGAAQEASAINLQLGLAAINQPLTASGNLVWKGEKLDIGGELNSVKSILEDKPAKATVTLAAAPVSAKFDGSLAVRDTIDLDGAVTAKSTSVRSLAKWLGAELPPATGFGPLEAKGQIRVAGKTITLSGANLALDGATATGQVSVDTGPERPLVKAVLQISELDLNKYMRPEGTPAPARQAAPQPAATPKPQAAPAGAPAKSIEDLLAEPGAKPGPKVQGYTQRAGWSNEPIDLASLGAVDADAKLAVGRLLFQDIKVGQSQLSVTLKNRVMKSTFDDVQLYGGRGRGFITLDGTSQKSASIGANLAIDGIDAGPFLQDTAGFGKLTGKGKLTLAVAGQGTNQRQMVETLNGKADFTFTDGAIKGINVAGMVRGISQGKLTGLGASPSEKTDFSELGATWTITNGIAQNQDLHLASPLMRLTGSGSVMLPAREADYMLRPKLVSSLSGQGGQDEQGLEIPVRVSGSWDKLSYTPDLAGIMKDPNKALDTVKQLGKQLGGRDAGDLVKGILGGGNNAAEPQAGQQTAPATAAKPAQQKLDAKGLLDQFLKPQ